MFPFSNQKIITLVPAPLISEDARAFRQITHVSPIVVEPDVTVETVTTTRVNVLDVLDTRDNSINTWKSFRFYLNMMSVADLEGACGACAPPKKKNSQSICYTTLIKQFNK